MNSNTQAIISINDETTIRDVIEIVLDGLTSVHSKRSYEKALEDFLYWWVGEGKPLLSKTVIQKYKTLLLDKDLSPGTVNLKLAAIRKLMAEAADNGLVDPVQVAGITKIKGVRSSGVRYGNRLNRSQAQALINAPDITRVKGLRDRALLAVMIGSGLRRSEVANLTFDHIKQRETLSHCRYNRERKAGEVSSDSGLGQICDRRMGRSGQHFLGRVFRPVHKGGFLNGDNITPQTVYDVVDEYSQQLGFKLAAHDLRRMYANLARKEGAELTQIQLTLGHANVATTQKYIGENLNLQDAPCDRIGILI